MINNLTFDELYVISFTFILIINVAKKQQRILCQHYLRLL
jgi:hypothetical protein